MTTSTTLTEKAAVVVGIDESEESYYALEWTIDHLFTQNSHFKLFVLHAKPTAASVVGIATPGIAELLPHVDSDLRKIAARVLQRAKDICTSKSVNDAVLEAMEGDARSILCEAAEKHHATILVIGNHGHGAIKRAVLGSVSDYCAHHAHCTVMIVKKPKTKH